MKTISLFYQSLVVALLANRNPSYSVPEWRWYVVSFLAIMEGFFSIGFLELYTWLNGPLKVAILLRQSSIGSLIGFLLALIIFAGPFFYINYRSVFYINTFKDINALGHKTADGILYISIFTITCISFPLIIHLLKN